MSDAMMDAFDPGGGKEPLGDRHERQHLDTVYVFTIGTKPRAVVHFAAPDDADRAVEMKGLGIDRGIGIRYMPVCLRRQYLHVHQGGAEIAKGGVVHDLAEQCDGIVGMNRFGTRFLVLSIGKTEETGGPRVSSVVIEVTESREMQIVVAGIGVIAHEVDDWTPPRTEPNWIAFANCCGGVNEVAVLKVMIIVHTTSVIRSRAPGTFGGYDAAPDGVIDKGVLVRSPEPRLQRVLHSTTDVGCDDVFAELVRDHSQATHRRDLNRDRVRWCERGIACTRLPKA